MRIAWFSPLPPIRSGIAAYTAEIVPRLASAHAIDLFDEGTAHDFVWKARRTPYDLVVYQLGNAPWHDYLWAYLAKYPGLVVLHDARLHHARARRLLKERRFDDYRREFAYDHPDAPEGVAEYAVEGLIGGSIYYFWSMLRVVMRTARMVAVHNSRVAEELREEYSGVGVDTIRMGVPPIDAAPEAQRRVRRELRLPDEAIVFALFGKMTAEKRIVSILQAFAALVRSGTDAFLLLVGDADGYPALTAECERHGLGARVRVGGYVADEAIGAHLAAADVCLCLRWPTAQETSASWLRCLAAGRATIVSDLAHLVDVPTLDPRNGQLATRAPQPVACAIDLLVEERALAAAMDRLAHDSPFRDSLARAGHAYWAAHHTVEIMKNDYERVLAAAHAHAAPQVSDLPPHFTDDYSEPARCIAADFGMTVDILR